MSTYYIGAETYVALKKQTDQNTAVTPTVFIPIKENGAEVNANYSPDRAQRGHKFGERRILRGNHEYNTDFTVLAEPNTVGYFLDMHFKRSGTTGANPYTHTFVEGEGNYYCIDYTVGAEVTRYMSVRGATLNWSYDNDQNLQFQHTGQAQHIFTQCKVKTGLSSGAQTTLDAQIDFTPQPFKALATTDTLQVEQDNGTWIDVALTGSTITDSGITGLTYTLTDDVAAGNAIRLKKQTPSFTSQEPFILGNTLVGFAPLIADAVTAAGSRATATPVGQELNITQDVQQIAEYRTGYMAPQLLALGMGEYVAEIIQTYDTESTLPADWANRTNTAMAIISTSTENTGWKMTYKFAKMADLENPVKAVGTEDIVNISRTLHALYDDTATYRLQIELINSLSTY